MKQVTDFVKGRLFRLEITPNSVYEMGEIVTQKNSVNIDHVLIRRLAFYMDGEWIADRESRWEQCNPYADCIPLQVLSMEP